MTAWSDYNTGDRVKILRGTALTQTALAEAAEVSVALVQKLEQGGTVRLSSLIKVADALGTDVGVLLGQQAPRRAMSRLERTALRAISLAVHDAALGNTPNVEPGTLHDLERIRAATWRAYWAGDYPMLGTLVPSLVAEAKEFTDSHEGHLREQGFSILADGFQVAACAANVLGRRDLAYAALAHAKTAADASGDELLTAGLAALAAWIYLRDGRLDHAVRVAEDAAASVEPRFGDASPERLSVFGNLMLRAAVSASRRDDKPRARDFLSQAHAAAARLGRDANLYQTAFGPTSANTQAVGIHLAFGNITQALDLIDRTPLPADMPKAAKSRYMLDVALTRCEAKQWDAATDALLDVCAEAPEWVRHQALAGVVAQRLGDVSTSKLQKVTQLLGVPLIPR